MGKGADICMCTILHLKMFRFFIIYIILMTIDVCFPDNILEYVHGQVRDFCDSNGVENKPCETIQAYVFNKHMIEFVSGDFSAYFFAYQSLRERMRESPSPSSSQQSSIPTDYHHHMVDRSFHPVATVNSFDIFDTILARSVYEPEDIFSLVEEQFPCPNFKYARRYAASMTIGSFDDIYDNLQRISHTDTAYIQSLKEFEFALELKHSYLIQQNYDLVNDGDILISDMYLPYDRIWTLLKAAGFNKSVNLFVSPAGKAHGWMWESISAVYDIKKHLGDNYHSDVVMALAYNVSAEHSTIHAFTALEKRFHSRGKAGASLAYLIRRMRHRNPFPNNSVYSTLFNSQVGVNLPTLLLVAQEVYDIMVAEGLTRLLLSRRDCCLLEKIFTALYPEIDSLPFHSSRIMFENPSEEFQEYIRRTYLPGKTLILDTNGAFKSGRNFFLSFFGYLPRVHLITFIPTWAAPFEGLSTSLRYNRVTESAGMIIEFLNADISGSLIDVVKIPRFDTDDNGYYNLVEEKEEKDDEKEEVIFVRLPMRYRVADVLVYHEAIDLFCATANKQSVREILQNVALENIDNGGGGKLSTTLLYDCAQEMTIRSTFQIFYRGKDFLDHFTLKVAINEESNRSGGSSFCNHHKVARLSSDGDDDDDDDDGNCNHTVLDMMWSWFAYVDIIAVEWSAHGGHSEANLRGMHLLLWEQQDQLKYNDNSSRSALLYPSFQSTTAALISYFGNLLRRIDYLHEFRKASSIFKDSLVLHAAWVNNSTADFPYGMADGEFTGQKIHNSFRSFVRRAAALPVTNSSINSSQLLFPVVLEVVDDCPLSWEVVLTRYNILRQMDNYILIPLQQDYYLYILLRRRNYCGDNCWDSRSLEEVDDEEEVTCDAASSAMKDSHLLHNLRVTCYYCPTFSSEELLRSYTSSRKIKGGRRDRGLCHSGNWRIVSPSSNQWTVCSLSPI
jgi:hypothetical protein